MERSNITSSLYFGPVLYKCTFLEKNHSNKEIRWEVIEPCTLRLERVQALSGLWQSQIYLMFHKPSEGNIFMLGLLQIQGFLACANSPLSSLLIPHG